MSIARRWQERRERVAREEAADQASPRTTIGSPLEDVDSSNEAATGDRDVDEQRSAERLEAEAVDLSALGPGADMSVFLREGVPAVLRRQAFRALWRSSPIYGDFERLNDYDEDFRNPKLVGAFKSAWEAGRGYAFPDKAEEEPADTDEPDVSEVAEPETVVPEAIDLPTATQAVESATDEDRVEIGQDSVEPEAEPETVSTVPSLRERLGV